MATELIEELRTLGQILRILSRMQPRPRARLIAYLADRCEEDAGPTP